MQSRVDWLAIMFVFSKSRGCEWFAQMGWPPFLSFWCGMIVTCESPAPPLDSSPGNDCRNPQNHPRLNNVSKSAPFFGYDPFLNKHELRQLRHDPGCPLPAWPCDRVAVWPSTVFGDPSEWYVSGVVGDASPLREARCCNEAGARLGPDSIVWNQ